MYCSSVYTIVYTQRPLLSAFHTAKWHSLHRLQTERILCPLTISVWSEVVEIENCRMFSSVNRPCWRARRTQWKGGIFSLHPFYQILRLKLIGVETILCYSYRRARTRCKASGLIGKGLFRFATVFLHLIIVKAVYRPNQFLLICLYSRSFSNFIYYLLFAYAKQVLWFVYIYILNWSCFLCKTGLARCLDIICDGSV